MASISKNTLVVTKATLPDDKKGIGAGVTIRPNLSTPAFADELRQALKQNPSLAAEIAAVDANARDYIVKHLGEGVIQPPTSFDKQQHLDITKAQNNVSRKAEKGAFTFINAPPPVLVSAASAASAASGAAEVFEASAASAADTSRNNTSLAAVEGGRFSMIVALSQWLINNNIEVLHWMDPTRQQLNVSDGYYGSIDNAELLPPKIAIMPTDFSRGRAMYYMNFGEAGTCTLKSGSGADDKVTFGTKDWIFVFEVDITLENLDPNSEEYQDVKEKFGKPGDYRITRLLANLETADIISPVLDECSFGDHDEDMKGRVFLSWQQLMLNWIFEASESGAGLLGYSLSIDSEPDDSVPASFPPTDQLFQCYPYIAPGSSYPTTGLGGTADNNMLLYLNMTSKKPFPSVPVLPYTGNWCTDVDRGTMAIGKDVFMESFLLPQLQRFNYASYLEPEKPQLKPDGAGWKIWFYHGKGNRPYSYFNWEAASGLGWPFRSWVWTKEHMEDNTRQANGAGRVWLEHTCTTTNAIRIEPGKNIIRLDHELRDKFFTRWRWLGTTKGAATVTRKVTYHIYVTSVHEGELEIRFPATEKIDTTTKRDADFFFDSGYVKDVARDLEDLLVTDDYFERVRDYLKRALQSYRTFVFPGGGYLFFKNPVFNKDGDLLCRLEFNGIDGVGKKKS